MIGSFQNLACALGKTSFCSDWVYSISHQKLVFQGKPKASTKTLAKVGLFLPALSRFSHLRLEARVQLVAKS